jgi:hypothetical protein
MQNQIIAIKRREDDLVAQIEARKYEIKQLQGLLASAKRSRKQVEGLYQKLNEQQLVIPNESADIPDTAE